MARENIKTVIMRRDGMTSEEADQLIAEAQEDFNQRISEGDFSAEDICEEYFGLEPDYLDEFLF